MYTVKRVIFVGANFLMNYPFKILNVRTAQYCDVNLLCISFSPRTVINLGGWKIGPNLCEWEGGRLKFWATNLSVAH